MVNILNEIEYSDVDEMRSRVFMLNHNFLAKIANHSFPQRSVFRVPCSVLHVQLAIFVERKSYTIQRIIFWQMALSEIILRHAFIRCLYIIIYVYLKWMTME